MDDKRFTRLDDKIDKLDEKVDQIQLSVSDINTVLIKQEENLKLHMYRTELAEENLKVLKSLLASDKNEILEKIKPIDAHVTKVKIITTFLLSLLGIVATISGIYVIFRN